MRKRDWDVITGWEKRIKVDFGSLGPSHARWSDWTYKERDIVARKVHESAGVSAETSWATLPPHGGVGQRERAHHDRLRP